MRERLERTRAAAATLLYSPRGGLRCTVKSYWSNSVRVTGQTALELLVKPHKSYWSNRISVTGQTTLELLVKPQSYWSNRVRITGQTALELLVKPP